MPQFLKNPFRQFSFKNQLSTLYQNPIILNKYICRYIQKPILVSLQENLNTTYTGDNLWPVTHEYKSK